MSFTEEVFIKCSAGDWSYKNRQKFMELLFSWDRQKSNKQGQPMSDGDKWKHTVMK